MPSLIGSVSRLLSGCVLLSAVLGIGFNPRFLQAQTYAILHNFSGGGDGAYPVAGLTADAAGNFYGTTCGNNTNRGTVYRFSRHGSSWVLSTLYTFLGVPDGSCPMASVVFGPDGALYGTTSGGGYAGLLCGSYGCGTVFKLQPPSHACGSVDCRWSETVLYRFHGNPDGMQPGYGNLIFDLAGIVYGTTVAGGTGGYGTVYKLTPSGGLWSEERLFSFSGGLDGHWAEAGVVRDSAGNLYGTTLYGGSQQFGVVYQLSPSGSGWVETVLHEFVGGVSDGRDAQGGLLMDTAGNLYGATANGGGTNSGVVYQLMHAANGWSYQVLYSFVGLGSGPWDALVMDSAGSLYGTTSSIPSNGSVFRLDNAGGDWTETTLHAFGAFCMEGCDPIGAVTLDSHEEVFGTTFSGGPQYGDGVIFQITQ